MSSNLQYLLQDATALAGDASTRRYYRVNQNHQNFILCHDPSLNDHNHPFININKLLLKHNIACPSIKEVDIQNKLILQEDLGDNLFIQKVGYDQVNSENYYQMAVDLILKIQAIDINSNPNQPCFSLKFDRDKYLFELEMTQSYFIEKFLNSSLSNGEKKICSQFYDQLIKKLLLHPQSLCHRDYHSKNLMLKDNLLYLIDYQDARVGSNLYDLVSLLEDCYIELSPTLKENLKNYFKTHSQANNEHFDQLYGQMSIQRIYKAIGSFCLQYIDKNNIKYLKYIGHAMESMKHHFDNIQDISSSKEFFNLLYSKYYTCEKHGTAQCSKN